MSDYENVREMYKKLLGGEKWFKERENRFFMRTKMVNEIENDKKSKSLHQQEYFDGVIYFESKFSKKTFFFSLKTNEFITNVQNKS